MGGWDLLTETEYLDLSHPNVKRKHCIDIAELSGAESFFQQDDKKSSGDRLNLYCTNELSLLHLNN